VIIISGFFIFLGSIAQGILVYHYSKLLCHDIVDSKKFEDNFTILSSCCFADDSTSRLVGKILYIPRNISGWFQNFFE
jgi:hypothetical protein